jgi:hypothetical protein
LLAWGVHRVANRALTTRAAAASSRRPDVLPARGGCFRPNKA